MSFYEKTFADIIVLKKQNSLWIKLNRPEMSNAISDDMIDSLELVLGYADEDNDIRVILITGEGKNFCAGGDIKAMESQTGMFAGEPNELRQRYRRGIQRIPKTIEALQTPIVAVVNGAAIGAGCDLSCMCDIRIASNKSKFAETFSKLSLVPGDGGTFFLQRVVGYTKAMEMFLTGDLYRAEEAKDMGLINYLVDHKDLENEAQKLADRISLNGPVALSMTKKALKMGRTQDLSSQLEVLAGFQGIAQRTSDHFEGLLAFKEKRDPIFTGQ